MTLAVAVFSLSLSVNFLHAQWSAGVALSPLLSRAAARIVADALDGNWSHLLTSPLSPKADGGGSGDGGSGGDGSSGSDGSSGDGTGDAGPGSSGDGTGDAGPGSSSADSTGPSSTDPGTAATDPGNTGDPDPDPTTNDVTAVDFS